MTGERERIRAAVAALYVNHVGQEGRGAAVSVRDEALRALEAEWAVTDAAEARRLAVLKALRAEVASAVAGTSVNEGYREVIADQITGHLSMFALSLDDRTWEPEP